MTVDGSALPGQLAADHHRLLMRVYYEDTDAAGYIYHANYLKFAERGRTEALYALGWDQARLYDDAGIVFVARRCEIDYLAPGRLGDLLTVTTRVGHIKGPRFVMEQAVAARDKVLARLAVTIVCVDRQGRPMRIPAPVSKALAGLKSDTA